MISSCLTIIHAQMQRLWPNSKSYSLLVPVQIQISPRPDPEVDRDQTRPDAAWSSPMTEPDPAWTKEKQIQAEPGPVQNQNRSEQSLTRFQLDLDLTYLSKSYTWSYLLAANRPIKGLEPFWSLLQTWFELHMSQFQSNLLPVRAKPFYHFQDSCTRLSSTGTGQSSEEFYRILCLDVIDWPQVIS